MKINDRNPVAVSGQVAKEVSESAEETARKGAAAPSSQSSGGSDRVVLSLTNERVDKVSASVGQIPDIRWDKVNDIKSRIEAGTYKVSGVQVAEKMLASLGKKTYEN
jgi:negative regulator of flagellin synthesis FlgM